MSNFLFVSPFICYLLPNRHCLRAIIRTAFWQLYQYPYRTCTYIYSCCSNAAHNPTWFGMCAHALGLLVCFSDHECLLSFVEFTISGIDFARVMLMFTVGHLLCITVMSCRVCQRMTC